MRWDVAQLWTRAAQCERTDFIARTFNEHYIMGLGSHLMRNSGTYRTGRPPLRPRGRRLPGDFTVSQVVRMLVCFGWRLTPAQSTKASSAGSSP
jgi:hypothetical protein